MRSYPLVLVMFATACSSPSIPAGTERGPCYGNGTCNAGLVCLSDLCVRAPASDAGADTGLSSDAGTGSDAPSTDAWSPDAAGPCGSELRLQLRIVEWDSTIWMPLPAASATATVNGRTGMADANGVIDVCIPDQEESVVRVHRGGVFPFGAEVIARREVLRAPTFTPPTIRIPSTFEVDALLGPTLQSGIVVVAASPAAAHDVRLSALGTLAAAHDGSSFVPGDAPEMFFFNVPLEPNSVSASSALGATTVTPASGKFIYVPLVF